MVDHWNNLFCWFALIFSPKMFFVCIIHILDYHQFQQKKLSYKSVFCLSKILNIYKKGFLWGRVNFWNAWEKIFGKKLKTLCFAWGVVTLDYSIVKIMSLKNLEQWLTLFLPRPWFSSPPTFPKILPCFSFCVNIFFHLVKSAKERKITGSWSGTIFCMPIYLVTFSCQLMFWSLMCL